MKYEDPMADFKAALSGYTRDEFMKAVQEGLDRGLPEERAEAEAIARKPMMEFTSEDFLMAADFNEAVSKEASRLKRIYLRAAIEKGQE